MWTDPQSVLYNKIQGAWLEFDMPEETPEIPVPSVFFNPANINYETSHDPLQYNWLIHDAIPSIAGRRLRKGVKENLKSCIRKMPRKTSLFIVGVMLSRMTTDIRMSILFRDSRLISSYLKSIGWKGEINTVERLVKDLDKARVNRMVLDYDVGKKIGQKIAIECSFYPNKYHKEKHWKPLLEFLAEKGWVTPSKKDELLSFPGEENGNSNIIRYITHLKIVYEPDKPLKVKAYLAIRHFLKTKNN
jgi:hypothetical protein